MTSRAWYRDDSEEHMYEPHHTDPPQYLTADEVFDKTGVRLTKVERCDDEAEQRKLQQDGGYNYFDWLDVSREALPDYDEKLKKFYTEHLHEDPEVRLITAGSTFFEIRDYQNKWIRLHVMMGDLIQLPPGIYHRMTLDTGKYVKMLRLFTDLPQWKAINRPEGDSSPARDTYLHNISSTEQ